MRSIANVKILLVLILVSPTLTIVMQTAAEGSTSDLYYNIAADMDVSNAILNELSSAISSCSDRTESGNFSMVSVCDKIILSFGSHMKDFFVKNYGDVTSALYPTAPFIPEREFSLQQTTSNPSEVSNDALSVRPFMTQISKMIQVCAMDMSSSGPICQNVMSELRKELDAFNSENTNDFHSVLSSTTVRDENKTPTNSS